MFAAPIQRNRLQTGKYAVGGVCEDVDIAVRTSTHATDSPQLAVEHPLLRDHPLTVLLAAPGASPCHRQVGAGPARLGIRLARRLSMDKAHLARVEACPCLGNV